MNFAQLVMLDRQRKLARMVRLPLPQEDAAIAAESICGKAERETKEANDRRYTYECDLPVLADRSIQATTARVRGKKRRKMYRV